MVLVFLILVASFGASLCSKDAAKKKDRRETGVLASILITFVFLPSASFVVFQSFVCDEETNTLKADAMVTCDYDDEYQNIWLLGCLGVLLWPLGVPSTYLYLLWSHYGPTFSDFKAQTYHILTGRVLVEQKAAASARGRGTSVEHVEKVITRELKDEHEEQMRLFKLEQTAPKYLHALNGEFETQFWWVPVFEQYRKLGITGVTILYGQGDLDQLILGMLIALVAALVYFSSSPYKDFNDDLFSMFTHFQIFLVLLWSLLVKFHKLMEVKQEGLNKVLEEYNIEAGEEDGKEAADIDVVSTDTLGWLLIASNVSVIFVFFAFMAVEVKSVRRSVGVRKRWDAIKGSIEERHTEDDVLLLMGMDLSASDRTVIIKKREALFGKEKREESDDLHFGDEYGDSGIELQSMEINRGKKAQKRQTKLDMAKIRQAGDDEIEMSTNPMFKNGSSSGAKAPPPGRPLRAGAPPAIKSRPFGGKHAADAGHLRHKSSADEVGLGAGDEPISKHEKYKKRYEEEHRNVGTRDNEEAGLAPHIARAKGFNTFAGKKRTESGSSVRSKANSRTGSPSPVLLSATKTDSGRLAVTTQSAGTAAQNERQPEWEMKFDDASGLNYYENRISGVSTWEKPADFDGV